jgi:hypothetical protein
MVREIMTEAMQQALTPDEVFAQLKAGNQRFVEGKLAGWAGLATAPTCCARLGSRARPSTS